jgi:hypothetical protein
MAAALSSSAVLAARPSLALKARAPRAARAVVRAPVAVRAQQQEKVESPPRYQCGVFTSGVNRYAR